MTNQAEQNSPIYLKIDFWKKRRYLHAVRRPFNFFYNFLIFGGTLFIIYVGYASGIDETPYFSDFLFSYRMIFTLIAIVIWVILLIGIRWYHRDSRILYKKWENLYLQKKELKFIYSVANKAETDGIEKIRYSAIKKMTMLTDYKSGLKLLALEAEKVEMEARAIMVRGRTDLGSDGYLTVENAIRYIPLYYKDNDRLINRLLEKTGLPIYEAGVDIGRLKQTRLFMRRQKR